MLEWHGHNMLYECNLLQIIDCKHCDCNLQIVERIVVWDIIPNINYIIIMGTIFCLKILLDIIIT